MQNGDSNAHPQSLPDDIHEKDAEPAQDPFGDHAEPSTFHHLEPAGYGRDFSPTREHHDDGLRPGTGAYYNGGTASYIGRQDDAANGLTMSGAHAVEVDSTSREGRLNEDGLYSADTSPVDARQPVTYRY